jgi:hypothetical protein
MDPGTAFFSQNADSGNKNAIEHNTTYKTKKGFTPQAGYRSCGKYENRRPPEKIPIPGKYQDGNRNEHRELDPGGTTVGKGCSRLVSEKGEVDAASYSHNRSSLVW